MENLSKSKRKGRGKSGGKVQAVKKKDRIRRRRRPAMERMGREGSF